MGVPQLSCSRFWRRRTKSKLLVYVIQATVLNKKYVRVIVRESELEKGDGPLSLRFVALIPPITADITGIIGIDNALTYYLI